MSDVVHAGRVRPPPCAASTLLAWLLLGSAVVGCSSEDDVPPVDPGPEIIDCTLGTRLGADFVPLAAPVTAELVLGFQGFVWIDLSVRADRSPGDAIAKVKYAYSIEGLQPASAAMTTRFEGTDAALRLLLSPADVAQLADRTVELSVRIEVSGLRCDASQTLTLRDGDPCIHVDDGTGCLKGGKP